MDEVEEPVLETEAPVEEEVEETPESTEEPVEDSLTELIAKVAELERRTARISEIDPLKSAIGRISALQSAVDSLKNTSTFSDPRVDDVEDFISSLVADIEDSLSDGTKNKYLSRQQQRQRQQMLDEIKKEVMPQATEPDTNDVDPLWAGATQELLKEARSLGLDINDPRIQWADPEDANRGLFAAMERVRANFRTIADADKAPERVTQRKAAAKPSPSSAGANRTETDIMGDESIPLQQRIDALQTLLR